MTAERLLCPSYRCEPGAQLLGLVQRDGTVAFTPDEIRIDQDFVDVARAGRTPEARFRFAGPCQKGRCRQWSEGRCGIADAVVDAAASLPASAGLPTCSIRTSCRWYAQTGEAACRGCALVTTEPLR